MKLFSFVVATILIVLIIPRCFILETKELDDVTANGPLKSILISKQSEHALFEGILAVGLSWDFDHDRFFISTDQPHSLFNNSIANFYVVNSDLDRIHYHKELATDDDLEGIAYIGNNSVAMISEKGTLYFLRENDGQWEENRHINIFTDDGPHILASLAFDREHQLLYTAEKEGKKIIYKINLEGNILESFEMEVTGLETKRPIDMSTDYTIAGMVYKGNHLFLLSEAYSTIFQYDLKIREVINVFGITDIHESSGITFRENMLFLVGDFESYLPPPKFYSILLPDYG